MSNLTRHRLFWPAAVLVLLLASNVFFAPRFFTITLQDGHLYGSLIDILRSATPLALVALGMTMVIATGGIDLSLGSIMAISGALACLIIGDLPNQNSVGGVLIAVGVALVLSALLGVWNGVLVSVIGIQPIIATLILMVAGRGIAQLITDGQIINVTSAPYRVIGAGYLLGIPVSVIIVAVVVAAAMLLVRRSALGVLIESVGASPTASRLAGIRARGLTITVYVFAAFCAGIAGLIFSSNVASADSNAAGNLIELDAILAVVIGGTALTGGRFSIAGSVLGAVLISALDITTYTIGVPAETTLLFKAVVVVVLCLSQSAAFRAAVFRRRAAVPATPAAEVSA
ncbi:ABC transporter permease [Amorphoplanes digitatis]|uniref:Simple sugar transport system permease protein n=1 Tax=Actinoplanes digitatis TaxID=1868 RepID=A0A7W7HZ58_9ACTN|nr:ABC transporter permease [Actinoplanes digitatis]MBB4763471.1 simple sugar transport system permease protein [Actinoplanes digitatis]GID92288.1 sugar ABC transporter permease [Actinoplanes digitatis]